MLFHPPSARSRSFYSSKMSIILYLPRFQHVTGMASMHENRFFLLTRVPLLVMLQQYYANVEWHQYVSSLNKRMNPSGNLFGIGLNSSSIYLSKYLSFLSQPKRGLLPLTSSFSWLTFRSTPSPKSAPQFLTEAVDSRIILCKMYSLSKHHLKCLS